MNKEISIVRSLFNPEISNRLLLGIEDYLNKNKKLVIRVKVLQSKKISDSEEQKDNTIIYFFICFKY